MTLLSTQEPENHSEFDLVNPILLETDPPFSATQTEETPSLPQVHHPWRRFFARYLDLSLYSLIWSAVLAFAFHANLAIRGAPLNLVDTIIGFALMIFIEPLLLHAFATTPGKAIFGLKVQAPDGTRLTYREGLARTWAVVGSGMGYSIPIYNLVRLWKSFKLCRDQETLPWDKTIAYRMKDTKRYRIFLYLLAIVLTFFLSFALMSSQVLPPNRGDLTIAEFSENYRYYADYYNISFGDQILNENGTWVKNDFINGSHLYELSLPVPEYQFTTENGYVTAVSCEFISDEELFMPFPEKHMFLLSLSFAAAQEDMGLFSNIPRRIANYITPFKSFQFSFDKTEVINNVTPSDDPATKPFSSLAFSVKKLP